MSYINRLQRGDQVVASQDLRHLTSGVTKGVVGVVVEVAGYNDEEDFLGPLVRWESGGICNIYIGDCEPLSHEDGFRPTVQDAVRALLSGDEVKNLSESTCGCCVDKRAFLKSLKPWQLPQNGE